MCVRVTRETPVVIVMEAKNLMILAGACVVAGILYEVYLMRRFEEINGKTRAINYGNVLIIFTVLDGVRVRDVQRRQREAGAAAHQGRRPALLAGVGLDREDRRVVVGG